MWSKPSSALILALASTAELSVCELLRGENMIYSGPIVSV